MHLVALCGSVVVKQFQEYVEPGSNVEGVSQRRNAESEEESVVLPLGDNTLTHNLGIPLVVVCTKVGHISHITQRKSLSIIPVRQRPLMQRPVTQTGLSKPQ